MLRQRAGNVRFASCSMTIHRCNVLLASLVDLLNPRASRLAPNAILRETPTISGHVGNVGLLKYSVD